MAQTFLLAFALHYAHHTLPYIAQIASLPKPKKHELVENP